MGPCADLDLFSSIFIVENNGIPCPCREGSNNSSVVEPVAWSLYHLSYTCLRWMEYIYDCMGNQIWAETIPIVRRLTRLVRWVQVFWL